MKVSDGSIPSFPPKPIRQQEARMRSLHVLARMRRDGISLVKASRLENIKPSTVRRHVGSELLQEKPGAHVRPSKADSFDRTLLVPTAFGDQPRVVTGSEE